MIAALLSLLHLIPGFTALAQFVVGKVYDSKVSMYQARWGTTRDVAVAAVQAEVASNQAKVGWMQAVASSWVLSFVVVGFAFPFIFYLNKVIVWDLCLGWGTTPPLKYALLTDWGGLIIGGIFITSGGVGIAHAIINRKD